jgi:hypothetical protein
MFKTSFYACMRNGPIGTECKFEVVSCDKASFIATVARIVLTSIKLAEIAVTSSFRIDRLDADLEHETYNQEKRMKQKLIDPKLVLTGIGAIREQIDCLSQTLNPMVKAFIESHPATYAEVRRCLHRGEAYARKVVDIHQALTAIVGDEHRAS